MPRKRRRVKPKPKKRHDLRDVLGRFRKKSAPRPPIMYKRPIPDGMHRVVYNNTFKQIPYGTLLEFVYGTKQKPGQTGGWKTDRIPLLLVFYDHEDYSYIEGINTNYLSGYYVNKLKLIMKRFPGLDGEKLYQIVKRTAAFALKKGYRKYIRSSLRNIYTYEYYKDEVQEVSEQVDKIDGVGKGAE